jgi:integrase/recombinase XerD
MNKTLTDLLMAYLAYGQSLRRSPYTLRSQRQHGQAFLEWLETTHVIRTADRLRGDHLEAWQKHLAAHRTGRGQPLKARSLNKHIECLRGFLGYLAAHGHVLASLPQGLALVQEPRLLPGSVLDHAQVKRVLRSVNTTHAHGYRDRTLLELLYSTGLRAAELLGLNVGDVDLTHATALVTGKGNKQRLVPIGRTALRMLESYLRAVRPFLVRHLSEPALFLNRAGNRLPYHTFLQLVHRYADAQDLGVTVTPHTFRRSCTTELIRGGANLYHVKELLGHESLETLKHYTKLTIVDLKKPTQSATRENGAETDGRGTFFF